MKAGSISSFSMCWGRESHFAVVSYILLIAFALTLAPHDFTTRLLIVLSGLVFLVNSMDAQWIFTARSRMWMVALRGAVGQLIYGGLILGLIRRPPMRGSSRRRCYLVAGWNISHLAGGPSRVLHSMARHLSRRLARLSARMPDHGFREHDVDDLRPDRYRDAALHAQRDGTRPLRSQLQHDDDRHVIRCNSRPSFLPTALREHPGGTTRTSSVTWVGWGRPA